MYLLRPARLSDLDTMMELAGHLDSPNLPHDEAFLPGTSADVEVILSAREDVMRIPTSTIIKGNEVLLFEDGLLTERQVTPGLRNWDFTEITDGLAEDDLVVTSLDRVEVKAGALAEIAEAEED